MDLTILIPAHNEEANIVNTIERLENSVLTPHQIIVINDHSTDSTKEVVRSIQSHFRNVEIFDNTYSAGFGNCIRCGIYRVNTKFFVLVMADLCDEPSSIDEMYNRINSGFDIICGSRYSKGGRRLGGARTKGFFSWTVSRSLHFITGIPTRDVANAFKMYRKAIFSSLEIKSNGFEISVEIPLKAYFRGYHISEVPTVWEERRSGRSNFKMWKVLPHYLRWYIWAVGRRIIHIFS